MEDRLKRQFDFILEIDKLKKVGRQTYLSDGSRKENDTEHSWHLAMMCMLMSEYANEKIDVLRTMSMVLIHDIIEIDAGDTYAYDVEAHSDKREREERAADRIFGMLPQDQALYMRELWEEFEAHETPEAKFALTLDKIQPVLLNSASGGKSWREHGVKKEQIMKRNSNTHEGSQEMWEYCKSIIEENIKKGNIKK